MDAALVFGRSGGDILKTIGVLTGVLGPNVIPPILSDPENLTVCDCDADWRI